MARKQNRANSFFDFAGDAGEDGGDPAPGPLPGGPPAGAPTRGGDPAKTGRLRLLDGDGGSRSETESLGRLEPIYGLEPPTPVETPPGGLPDEPVGRAAVRKLSLLETAGTPTHASPASSGEAGSPERRRVRKLSLLDTAATQTDEPDDSASKAGAAAPKPSRVTRGGAMVPMPAETLVDTTLPPAAGAPSSVETSRETPGVATALDFHQDAESAKSAETRYEELKALSEQNPDEVGPLVGLANVCIELRREAEAKTLLRRARELDPKNSYVRRRLRALGDQTESREARTSQVARFLRAAAVYPMRSASGRLLWIGAALLSGVAAATIEFEPLLGGVLLAVTLVLASGYLHQVVVTAVRGAERPPAWPEAGQAVIGSKRVVGAFAACFALPAALFAVSLVLGAVTERATAGRAVEASVYEMHLASLRRSFQDVDGMGPDQAQKAAEEELVAAGVRKRPSGLIWAEAGTIPLAFLGAASALLLFGLLYFPMAIATSCELDNPRIAFNYPHGVGQAVRAFSVYLPVALCSVGVAVVSLALLWSLLALFPWPVLGTALAGTITALLSYYLTGALCFLSGRAYPLWEREFS